MPTLVNLLLRLRFRFRSTISVRSSHVHMDILFVANCSDPRMSQIVIHGGIVYLSGQVDQEATDAEGQTKGETDAMETEPCWAFKIRQIYGDS